MIKNRSLLEKRINKFWPYIFLTPFFIFHIAFFAYPTLFSFYISLTNWDSLMDIETKKFVGFANYIKVFTDDPFFFKALFNNFIFMIVSIPVELVCGLLLAIVLYRVMGLRRFFQTLNILPYLTTPVAIGVIFAFLFDWSTGIVNKVLLNMHIIKEAVNWLGVGSSARIVVILVLIWKNFGYYLIIYLAGLSTIPIELNEAAFVDGASEKQIFFNITLPSLKPITLFLVITSIMNGLQLFDEPMMLLTGNGGAGASAVGGPGRSCLTAIMYFFDMGFGSSSLLGYSSAIAYSIFIFISVFSFISFKIFSRGAEKA